mmetsp:Transcript_4962/g.16330  ORF Transcript_4962/g.16330 Transcript_4962/m.16330 type:complete len:202 (-) Transcript_4962:234-839(-)
MSMTLKPASEAPAAGRAAADEAADEAEAEGGRGRALCAEEVAAAAVEVAAAEEVAGATTEDTAGEVAAGAAGADAAEQTAGLEAEGGAAAESAESEAESAESAAADAGGGKGDDWGVCSCRKASTRGGWSQQPSPCCSWQPRTTSSKHVSTVMWKAAALRRTLREMCSCSKSSITQRCACSLGSRTHCPPKASSAIGRKPL